MDFFPQSIKAYSAVQFERSVCLLRVCEARRGRACSGLLGRPPELERACTPVLCLVNSAIVARSHSTMLSLPIWRAIQRLSLIGSDCSHSGQLGALPPVQWVPAPQQWGPAAWLLQFLDRAEPAGARRELRFKQTSRDVNSHIWMCLQKEQEGGAVAVATAQTLSQQLSKTVFTKTKFSLSGLHFFMDGWFQFNVRLRGKKGILAHVWTELATSQSQNCPAGHPVSTTFNCLWNLCSTQIAQYAQWLN